MIKQAFQHAELRDANDNIIQQGAYGKHSPLANETNDAWIDFVMNNLEALYDDYEDISEDLTVEDLTVEDLTITGTGTAPTVAANDNSNKIATTAYADRAAANAAAALVNSAPGTLDTLAELAAALGDDPNFAATIATLIDTKSNAAYEKALLDAHPVGSFYESTDSTSPATLFGGTWQEQIPDGELLGSIAYFAGQNSAPDGWVLCDGSAVSRDTYATLFSAIGTTYGAGDGSTTFALPNLMDKFVEGSATAGIAKSAGLPNITGSVLVAGGSGSTSTLSPSGAFGANNSIELAKYVSNGTYNNTYGITFSAKKSNNIYGNSDTVQPPALTMRPFIYTGKTSVNKWIRTA